MKMRHYLDFVHFLTGRSEGGTRQFIIFFRGNGCDDPINEKKNNKIAGALPGDAGKKCTKSRLQNPDIEKGFCN